MYRIYVPDRGFNYAGGVPLPTVKLALADGRASYDPAYKRDQFALSPIDFSKPEVPTPQKIGGAYFPNVFNTYLRTFINREFGKVLVIRFKPWPVVPLGTVVLLVPFDQIS